MSINRKSITRIVSRLLFSAILFAALLGGPIILLNAIAPLHTVVRPHCTHVLKRRRVANPVMQPQCFSPTVQGSRPSAISA